MGADVVALLNDKIHRQMDMLCRHRFEMFRAIRYNGTDLVSLVAQQEAELRELMGAWEAEEK